MLPLDAALKGLAALVSAAFAVTLLAGGARRRGDRWLVVFLLLIAGNQGAEAVRAMVTESAQVAWFRVATVFASLDPAALWTFAAMQPAFAALRRPALMVPVWGAAMGLVAWTFLIPDIPPSIDAFVACLLGFTYVCYGTLLLRFTRVFLARPDEPTPRALVPALMVVFLPIGLDAVDMAVGSFALLAFGGPVAEGLQIALVADVVALAAFGIALAFLARGASAEVRRVMLLGALVAGGVAVLLRTHNLMHALSGMFGSPAYPGLALVGRSGAPVRWLLFGAFVSMATVRHDALGMSLAARRRAARVLVALSFLSAAALVLVLVGLAVPRRAVEVRAVDVALIAAALALSQGFRRLVDRVALRVYGVPMPADLEGRHETYRLAAGQAAAQGRSPERDARLGRLREELGLDAATAEVLERLGEESIAGALSEGQRVAGRYRVGRLVGSGGEARVFLAHDERLDRPVVLKEVPQTPGAQEDLALREARLAGAVAHPNVLVVHDALRRRGFTVLVTEHAPGGSLAARLEKGPLPEKDARRLLEEILAGLAAVHAKGVVHRDLKPANVLLTADGSARIADFGLARLRRGATTVGAGGGLLGTPGFMAPEQRRGEAATPASDVYAVGVLARALFAGAPPREVASALDRALAEAPSERWPDAGAMLDALRRG